MTVLQFNDADFNEIKIFTFGKYAMQSEITVYPVLDENARYMVNDKIFTSSAINENGISLDVDWMNRLASSYAKLKKLK